MDQLLLYNKHLSGVTLYFLSRARALACLPYYFARACRHTLLMSQTIFWVTVQLTASA